jgi:hypothetical protein
MLSTLMLISGGLQIAGQLAQGVSGFFAGQRRADDQESAADIQGRQNDLAEKRYNQEYDQTTRNIGLQKQQTLGGITSRMSASGVKSGVGSAAEVANTARSYFDNQNRDAAKALQLGMESVAIGRAQEDRMNTAADVTRRNSWWSLFGGAANATATGLDLYDAYSAETKTGPYA